MSTNTIKIDFNSTKCPECGLPTSVLGEMCHHCRNVPRVSPVRVVHDDDSKACKFVVVLALLFAGIVAWLSRG